MKQFRRKRSSLNSKEGNLKIAKVEEYVEKLK
jgi:hypothetical protein